MANAELRHMTEAERALAETARSELKALAYPDQSWVSPVMIDDMPCTDVLVVGGGQSGLAVAHGLRRDGVTNVTVLDERPAGQEGVWEHFARMAELRTPKTQNGIEFGQPSLSLRAWYEARHGVKAWQQLTRIPRTDWMAYLRWYRATLDLPVENEVAVLDIRPGPARGVVAVRTSAGLRLARFVVLATGFEGAGVWRVPPVVAEALPASRYDHACTPIDFTRFKHKRIGILGHGASAFDAAVVALRQGATSVDLCFRRPALPVVNPHRHLETAGMMAHWPALDNRVRWNIARHMREFDQPPGVGSFAAAIALPGFRMHAGSPWEAVSLDADSIRVVTPRRTYCFDHVICATGYTLNLSARPELGVLAAKVALWRDRFDPTPDEARCELVVRSRHLHPCGRVNRPTKSMTRDKSTDLSVRFYPLGAFPYLDDGYEFLPRSAGDDWVSRVHCFNFAAYVSMGPHSTSISGHKHALPRLLRAVERRLLLEQEDRVLSALRDYDDPDLTIPPDLLEEPTHA